MIKTFHVTFETITPESAEHGDIENAGFIVQNVTLRDAIHELGYGDGGTEANEYPVTDPRWITVFKTNENYATGEIENRSIHLPDNLTPATKLRIARLLECHGC